MNAKGTTLLKQFEGKGGKPLLKAYHGAADREGIFTIGYGHVITGHEEPDLFESGQMMADVKITMERADSLLADDVSLAIQGIKMRLGNGVWSTLNLDQQAAIISFVFNVGVGNFGISTVRRLLNGEAPQYAWTGFKSFVRSNGEMQDGLIRRRAAEVALFKSDYPMLEFFMNNSGKVIVSKAAKYIGLGGDSDDD